MSKRIAVQNLELFTILTVNINACSSHQVSPSLLTVDFVEPALRVATWL